jgi:hypothetical protein
MSAITRGLTTTISSTIGTSSAVALAANKATNFLQIQNTSSTNSLAYTLDGTTPVINGNGNTLSPLGSSTFDVYVPTGVNTVVGSAANTSYTIVYA